MSRGAHLPVFKPQTEFVGGELAAVQPEPGDLLGREAVCKRLSISRRTLLRWIREWEFHIAAKSSPEQLLGVAGCFPPATHGTGTWKRWERQVLDAWCEAARVKAGR